MSGITGHAQIHLHMRMRYFAYDNQLHMAAVPCPIWFTDRQDSSANYNKAETLQGIIDVIAPVLLYLFEACRINHIIPGHFKEGILTSIPKKGKSPHSLENHRGITVNTLIGKVMEIIVLNRFKHIQREGQSDLQFGFTEGITPSMATLVITEARTEAKESKKMLLLATLDARKAFDTVSHPSLLRKIYLTGADVELVAMMDQFYQGMTTKVRWGDKISRDINILQGTRQGGVLSPVLYKTYLNDVLQNLEYQGIGATVGDLYIGSPTVADDVALLCDTASSDLQIMMSMVEDYVSMERYSFNSSKCEITSLVKKDDVRQVCYIDSDPVCFGNSAQHLGLVHSSQAIQNDNIVKTKVSLLYKTVYSLIGTGLHGLNGVGPFVSYRIYQAYVLPRVMYGLPFVTPNAAQVQQLELAHRRILRQLQSLPQRTAIPAIYLMLGVLPFEAILHLGQLSGLLSIIFSSNERLKNVMNRQLAMKSYKSSSWFVCVVKTLRRYGLPSVLELLNCDDTKAVIKKKMKKAVNEYWTAKLREECREKKTLQFINIDSLSTWASHPVWRTVKHNQHDVERAHVKARLLTDTYTLGVHRAKFDRNPEQAMCKLCCLSDEDRVHFLVSCSALFTARAYFLEKIEKLVVGKCGYECWKFIASDEERLLVLYLDCTSLRKDILFRLSTDDIYELEALTRMYCYRLHRVRVKTLEMLMGESSKSSTEINSTLLQPLLLG